MKTLAALLALISSTAFAQFAQYQHLPNLPDGGPSLGTPQQPYLNAYISNLNVMGGGGVSVDGGIPIGSLATPLLGPTVNYWVNVDAGSPGGGSDSNWPCTTSAAPCQHMQFVLDQIPLIPRQNFIINARQGTYAETLVDNHIYSGVGPGSAAITVLGVDKTTPSITGSTTGTLGTAPSSGATWTATIGTNWLAHALKGMFVQLTSGSDNGRLYPIADNSTNTLDLPTYRSQLNSATFNIVQNGVTISIGAGQSASVIVANTADGLTTGSFVLQGVNIAPSNFFGVYVYQGAVLLNESYVSGFTVTGVDQFAQTAQAIITRSYIQNSGALSGWLCNGGLLCQYGALVIDGGGAGIKSVGVVGPLQSFGTSSGHLIVQGTSVAGMWFSQGPSMDNSFSNNKVILRNGTGDGLRIESGAHFLMQNWEITGNTGHGIRIYGADYLVSGNSINANGCTITGNGGDGVHVETSHNALMFFNDTISSNTGVGVNFVTVSGDMPSTHNSAAFGSGVTMASNGHDLSIDGTNFSTIANLRAQSGKFIIDTGGPGGSSALFNRFTAY